MDNEKIGRGRPKVCDQNDYCIIQLRMPKALMREIDEVLILEKKRLFNMKLTRQAFIQRLLIDDCAGKRVEFANLEKLR